ncbi:MAG: flagellar hook-basal body complex protein FliE [Burkholderiaceae bacterium]|jgi:flagellar hook-basal body complex protein FliE|nr:flagellar hook-basal body complex protein FliE [Burkholderiaceae bacterium]
MDVRFPAFQPPPTTATAGSAGVAGASARALTGATTGAGGATDANSFSGALKDALQGVSRLQDESATLQRQFLIGAEGASLEQTMMAMQKSQVAFQAALTVRNRLVAAYTDIMNMPV